MSGIPSVLARAAKSYLWVAALVFLYFDMKGSMFSRSGTGFYCDDTYIQKPFRGDTISFRNLIAISIGSTVLLIIVTELLTANKKFGVMLSFLRHFHHSYKTYILGLTYVATATNLLKFVVRELRPHFIDSCRPDWSKINCSQGLVTKYNCTGDGPSWLVDKDIYQSFPSGHASVSFYTFVFVALYVRSKIRESWSQLSYLPSVVQLCFLLWTAVCCITRITDFRHHWWDVLTGALLGATGAFITVKYGSLHRIEYSHKEEHQQ